MADAGINTKVAKEAAKAIGTSLENLTEHSNNLSKHVIELQQCWHGGENARKWYNNISKHYDSITKKIEEAKKVKRYLGLLGNGWTKG